MKVSIIRRFQIWMPILLGLGAAVPTLAAPPKPVLAFYTSWDPPSSVNYSKVTHLLFAFLLPNGDGSFSGSVPGNIVSAAHSAGVKCLASVGGANNSQPFSGIVANSSTRNTFINNLKSFCTGNNLDGIDIDWEFPASTQDSSNFTLLMQGLRTALGTGKLISADVAPSSEKGQWVSRGSFQYVDFFNIMSFDYTGDFPGSLVGQPAPYNQVPIAMQYWKVRGVMPSHEILGLPFYGADFSQGGASVAYSTIVSQNPNLSASTDQVGQLYFNGPATITQKTTYVAQLSYGGAMIWEMGQDAPSGPKSLLDAALTGLAAPVPILAARRLSAAAGKTWLSLSGTAPAAILRDLQGRMTATSISQRPSAGIYFTPHP